MKSRTGNGKISASGGNGFAGGGGGRVSIDVFSRHDETEVFVHGMSMKVTFCLQRKALLTLLF